MFQRPLSGSLWLQAPRRIQEVLHPEDERHHSVLSPEGQSPLPAETQTQPLSLREEARGSSICVVYVYIYKQKKQKKRNIYIYIYVYLKNEFGPSLTRGQGPINFKHTKHIIIKHTWRTLDISTDPLAVTYPPAATYPLAAAYPLAHWLLDHGRTHMISSDHWMIS